MRRGRNNLIAVFFFAVLLSACGGSNPISKYNTVTESQYTVFLNDSLHFAAEYFGDYIFLEPEVGLTSILRQAIGLSVLSGELSKKNMVFENRTVVEPIFHTGLFVIPSKNYPDTFFQTHFYERQRIDSVVYYKKPYKPSDSSFAATEYVFPSTNRYLVLMVVCDEKENITSFVKPPNVSELRKAIEDENKEILNTFLFDKAYDEKLGQSRFPLAKYVFSRKWGDGNYLGTVKMLEQLEPKYVDDEQWDFIQVMMMYVSFLGDEAKLKKYKEKWNTLKSDGDTTKPVRLTPALMKRDSLQIVSAKKVILDAASHEQVVMFNESHFDPQHRYFVSSLLEDLYKQGFRYLAMEDLDRNDSLLNARQFPLQSSGTYTTSYQMANLIRHAIKLGYKMVAYEPLKWSSPQDREDGEASNLYQKTISRDPKAKVVVLAGFSHINEHTSLNSTADGSTKWMAERFKELSGIDPLTVNQTSLENLQLTPDLEHGEPFCVFKSGQMAHGSFKLSTAKSQNDIYICNPLSIHQKKLFPSATVASKEIKLSVPKEFVNREKFALVIYDRNEDKIAQNILPLFIAPSSTDTVTMQLPKGEYKLFISNKTGRGVYSQTVKVE